MDPGTNVATPNGALVGGISSGGMMVLLAAALALVFLLGYPSIRQAINRRKGSRVGIMH